MVSIRQTNRLIEYLRRFARYDGVGRTDGQLLDSFVQRHDDAAVAALVRRHGPMVWGVCCRMLRNHQDAEDAFQAAFLVLVQKAATLRDKETVGNWLYGVAHQTAVRMRALAARRGARERQVAAMPEPTSAEQYVWNDLRPVLDEELARLPAKYRTLIVLCDLEGKTRKDTARQLGIPEGTVASRLAAARTLLAKRLSQRGVVVSGLLLGSVLTHQAASAGVPLAVVSATIKAAALVAAGQAVAEMVSPSVAALVTGGTKAMAVTKIKGVLAVVVVGLALGGSGMGVGLFPNPMAVAQQPGAGTGEARKPGDKETPKRAVRAVQIRIAGPVGMNVSLWPESGGKDLAARAEAPCRLNLERGKKSRLKLHAIPNRPGLERFPTVEIPQLDEAAEAFLTSSAIPIEFTDKDFDTADKGGIATTVLFLEDGKLQTVASHGGAERKAIEEAKKRGSILAVVRMGNVLLGKVERVKDGEQTNPVRVEIGNDGRGPGLRLDDGVFKVPVTGSRDGQRAEDLESLKREVIRLQKENESLRQRAKQAEVLERDFESVQAELQKVNESLRQRAKQAAVLERSLRSALEIRDRELIKLRQQLELTKPRQKGEK